MGGTTVYREIFAALNFRKFHNFCFLAKLNFVKFHPQEEATWASLAIRENLFRKNLFLENLVPRKFPGIR